MRSPLSRTFSAADRFGQLSDRLPAEMRARPEAKRASNTPCRVASRGLGCVDSAVCATPIFCTMTDLTLSKSSLTLVTLSAFGFVE